MTTTVEEILERKSHAVTRDAENAPTHDIREALFELEAKGEIIVQRVPENHVDVTTKYGRTKKIPIDHTWHHKSCGQCGHIPGYTSSTSAHVCQYLRREGRPHPHPA